MFTKKPLAGISCASCERNITNISGNMADYQPWKKLPFREPNDRISKVILRILNNYSMAQASLRSSQ